MKVYPAIDVLNGRVVRLEKGDYDKKTEYQDDPINIAKSFETAGAEYIHIVDLDGAKAKVPVNLDIVKNISEAVTVPIQVGGGIRSVETASQMLKYADRVIIGTIAVTKPELLRQLLNKFGPDKIVVSIDYKNAEPAVNGWLETVPVSTQALKERLSGFGAKTLIITDTAKDGLLNGPNIELMRVWRQSDFELICAGGVSSKKDIEDLKLAGVDGAIIGKALYENKLDLRRAISAC